MPGVPWSAKKTMSRSPALTVAGIWTLCVVESVGNDVDVTDWIVGNPELPPDDVNVAVYVAGELPATTLWVWAPASDHDAHEFVEPTMTVRVNGAVPAVLPRTSWSPTPLGSVVSWNVVVCGSSRTLLTSVWPPESRAVRRTSR